MSTTRQWKGIMLYTHKTVLLNAADWTRFIYVNQPPLWQVTFTVDTLHLQSEKYTILKPHHAHIQYTSVPNVETAEPEIILRVFFFLKAKVISYDDGRSHGHMCSISRDRLHYSKAEKLSRGPLVLLYVGQMKCASSTHTGIKAAIDKLLQVIHTHNILLLFTKFSRNRDFQIWELHNRLTEC